MLKVACMRARSGGLFHDDHYVREHELRGELTVWVGTLLFDPELSLCCTSICVAQADAINAGQKRAVSLH